MFTFTRILPSITYRLMQRRHLILFACASQVVLLRIEAVDAQRLHSVARLSAATSITYQQAIYLFDRPADLV